MSRKNIQCVICQHGHKAKLRAMQITTEEKCETWLTSRQLTAKLLKIFNCSFNETEENM